MLSRSVAAIETLPRRLASPASTACADCAGRMDPRRKDFGKNTLNWLKPSSFPSTASFDGLDFSVNTVKV
jgi:hypothetical protein